MHIIDRFLVNHLLWMALAVLLGASGLPPAAAQPPGHNHSAQIPADTGPPPPLANRDRAPMAATGDTTLELSAPSRAMAGVETAPVERRRLRRELRVVGKVGYNEAGLADVVARVDGYIERLFVDTTGVVVHAGDHLVEIYSPDLVLAQQELLLALKSTSPTEMAAATTRKLLRWGVTQAQVDELARSRKIRERLTLYSPIKGTVIDKLVVRQSAVKPGDVLYRLADLESVWVRLDLYESDLSWVQYGQEAEVRAEACPGESFIGRVWFVSPVLNDKTRTVEVRLNIDNGGRRLKPGMYVSGVIRAELGPDGAVAASGAEGRWSCPMHPLVLQARSGPCQVCDMPLVQIPGLPADARTLGDPLAVPVSAVLDSGLRQLVFVEREPGRFAPVEIVTGLRADAFYPVVRGLKEGDRVAVRGAFLLDSQLQIRGLPSLFAPEGQAAAGHDHGPVPGAQTSGPTPAAAPAGPPGRQHPPPTKE